MREKILKVLRDYDLDRIKIGTLGSHSALNILKGAKDEGFETVCICRPKERIIYESFGVADEIIEVDDFKELLNDSFQDRLIKENVILIPHGSFNAYLGQLDKIRVPFFGNRELMIWETDRFKQRRWLEMAGLKMPKSLKPEEIDGIAIVKYHGAMGGRGYFLVANKDDFYEKFEKLKAEGLVESLDDIEIQEYIVGANVYFSFFYSPMNERIELIAMDRRYEAIDGIGRIPAEIQIKSGVFTSYTVIGNFPIVLRESLLAKALESAKAVVEVSKEIAYPGMVGPFCLETVFDDNAEMYVFEISARIVAGTNVGIPNSPYSYVLWGENMYMGRRIAREIRVAIEKDALGEIIY